MRTSVLCNAWRQRISKSIVQTPFPPSGWRNSSRQTISKFDVKHCVKVSPKLLMSVFLQRSSCYLASQSWCRRGVTRNFCLGLNLFGVNVRCSDVLARAGASWDNSSHDGVCSGPWGRGTEVRPEPTNRPGPGISAVTSVAGRKKTLRVWWNFDSAPVWSSRSNRVLNHFYPS